jgi:acyl-CoA synthetase (AMP-forming)/AMP-acid ligase II
MNIVDPIIFQARMNPEGLAICTPGTELHSVTYAQLVRIMNNIGRRALWEGLKRGDTVAILVQEKIFHAAILLALTRLGIVTVSARSTTLPKELAVTAVVTDRIAAFENAGRVLVVDLGWTEGDGKPMADRAVYQGEHDDICRIVLTSGTTGEAKGVAFSHRMVTERNARYHFIKGDRFAFSSRMYCDLGLASNPGFRFLVYMLTKGGTIFFHGDSPEGTAQAFDLYKIQNMFAGPAGLAEYLKFFEQFDEFQCHFDHITAGGGVMSKSLCERVRARMTPVLYLSYGATEACTMAAAPTHLIEDTPGAVGWVAPGVTIEIVDESDRVLPPGKEGIVRVRSAYVVPGYVGDPPAGRRSLRDGYFYPGDIGYLTADQLLVILGRDNLVLNLGGDKVAPEVVEQVLLSFRGIEDAAVFTRHEELGVPELAALIVSRASLDEEAIAAHCGEKLGAGFVPRRFVRVDRIPRNEAGKIERHRLPEVGARNP